MKNEFCNRYKIWLSIIKQKVKIIKRDIGALYLAYKRPDVPFYAKLVSVLVVGYALSPIDLIPDFIPVLGYLDDLILIPIGIAFTIRLIPEEIMEECRKEAENVFTDGTPKNWVAGGIIISIWIIIVSYILYSFLRLKKS